MKLKKLLNKTSFGLLSQKFSWIVYSPYEANCSSHLSLTVHVSMLGVVKQ
jgi:hypothetical protein